MINYLQNDNSLDWDYITKILEMEDHPNYRPLFGIKMEGMPGHIIKAIKIDFDLIRFNEEEIKDFEKIK
jgi:hypothetical protein